MHGKRLLVSSVALMLCIVSCSGGSVSRSMAVKNLGKEKVVKTSGSIPDWAFDKPMFVKNGVLYVSGMFTDAPNLGKGLHLSDALARAKIAKSLRERLRDDLTYASEGLEVENTALERILTSSTDEIVLNGIFQNSQHYEKKQVQTLSGIAYRYDCFTLIEMPQAAYLAMLDKVIKGQNGKPGVTEEFRAKVDARQRAFFDDLTGVNAEAETPAPDGPAGNASAEAGGSVDETTLDR